MGKKTIQNAFIFVCCCRSKSRVVSHFPMYKTKFAFSDHAHCCPSQRAGLLLMADKAPPSWSLAVPRRTHQGSAKPLLGLTL